MLPTLPRPAAAFGGASADQVALHVGKTAEPSDAQRLGMKAEPISA